jgi:hypothetical protein
MMFWNSSATPYRRNFVASGMFHFSGPWACDLSIDRITSMDMRRGIPAWWRDFEGKGFMVSMAICEVRSDCERLNPSRETGEIVFAI